MRMRSKTLMVLMLLTLFAAVISPAAYAQIGSGGNTCVFVFGTINGRTVTTPSIMIVVPPTDVVLGSEEVRHRNLGADAWGNKHCN